MGSLDDLRDFDIDMRPRGAFEIAEEDIEGKSRVGVAIGFIVAGVFVFLKEVLFSSSQATETNNQRHTDGKNGTDLSPSKVDLSEDSGERSENDGTEISGLVELPRLGSGTVAEFFSQSVRQFDVANPAFQTGGNGAPLLNASNDNPSSIAQSASLFRPIIPEVFKPLSSVAPGAEPTGARAVVRGDSVVVASDDPGTADFDPSDDDPPGEDSTTPPASKKNRAPFHIGSVTLDGALINQSIIIAASQLLFLTTDADGDELRINDLSASSGTLSLTTDGLWNFTPDLNYVGGVTFSYDVSDGEFGIPQTAMLSFSQVPGQTILGTENSDVLIGSPGNDIIEGFGASDIIHGGDGDDIIRGGSGDDRIIAGDGDDTIYGGAGNDLILGGAGDDVVFGGEGDDTIFGEGGSDTLFGGAGDDILNGGDGNDIVHGGEGNDQIWGEAGNDLLDGGDGQDIVFGGDGSDVIIGGLGQDVAHGGSNDDIFIADMDDGDDDYYGDDGFDDYDISRTLAGADINLATGTASSSDIGSDQLTDIENVIGSQGDDTVVGDASDNTLHGEDGDDLVMSDLGNDIIIGGGGNDTLYGDDGDDLLYGGNGDDRLNGKDGDDLIIGDMGNDRLDGEDGDDLLFGGNGNDRLRGEDGNDTLFGDDGADDIEGNDGNDILVGGFGNDTADGGKGNDLFIAEIGDGDDDYYGDEGVDTYDLSLTSADATIDLSEGRAVSLDIGLDQLDGFENIVGGTGNDTLIGSSHANVFHGGPGNDTFVYRSDVHAGLGKGQRDHIEDFEIGDKIDISYIDADEDEAGNQSFDFVLDTNSTIEKGDLTLRYEIDDDDVDAINTIITGFLDDDQLPDFEISLSGRHNFDDSNLIGVNFLMHA